MPDDDVPPKDDEIEISVFGPGYGESVLIHMGCGQWLVVDSCQDRASMRSAPMQYLHSLGLDPNDSVTHIVATHWHDDHARGIFDLIRTCRRANLYFSQAMTQDEFLQVVGVVGRDEKSMTSGVREFYRVWRELLSRAGPDGMIPNLSPTAQDRIILNRQAHGECPSAFVVALSPSDASVVDALQAFRELIPQDDAPRVVISAPKRNHNSVVLRVDVGDVSVLLGADLERTGSPLTGWTAVLDGTAVAKQAAQVFKVPHHGSEDAEEPRVWAEMIDAEPIAIVTPFTRRTPALPTPADKARLCAHTARTYISSAVAPREIRRSGVLAKTMKRAVRSIREAEPRTGRVRLRKSAMAGGAAWRIEFYGDAAGLC